MNIVRSKVVGAQASTRASRAEARRIGGAPSMHGSADAQRAIETVRDADIARPLAAQPELSYEVVQIAEVVPRTRSERLSRVVNIVIAVLALAILSPLLLLIGLAIKLSSRGPVLYIQTRVGLDRRWNRARAMFDRRAQNVGGRVFAIYKFRSMTVDAEHANGAVWATQNDVRVTPLGRVLRQFRLDELPQLINVIKGDMNIVGPRPERPSIVVQLREQIHEYPMRLRAKPGITGWAQINHSYDACIEDVRTKVRYDLEYLQRQSMAEDLRIMCRTLPVMLFKKGGW